MSDTDKLYLVSAKAGSPSNSFNPPPRPPKSPAIRRKDEAGHQHEPLCPPRPPKPDRFKSPQRGCNENFNNNITKNIEDASPASMKHGAKVADVESAVRGRQKLAVIKAKETRNIRKSSSFEQLHESFHPKHFLRFLTEDPTVHLGASHVVTKHKTPPKPKILEFSTYVDPRAVIGREHCHNRKKVTGSSFSNPNYEDSLESKHINLGSKLASPNSEISDEYLIYDYAKDVVSDALKKPSLTDDDCDYEYPPGYPNEVR